MECDSPSFLSSGQMLIISTHALTWSATPQFFVKWSNVNNFNSRTHVECDNFCLLTDTNGINFNSRTHVECDQQATGKSTVNQHFNSRTHVECDIHRFPIFLVYRISTHALTWSATQLPLFLLPLLQFQLTHSRGVRPPFL